MALTIFDPTQAPGIQPNNLLDNGGFEIWQRGTTFTNPASGAYTADRWATGKSAGITVNITKDTTTFDSGTASIKVDTTVAANNQMYLIENIETFADYRGKTVSFSARVKTSTASKIRLAMADGVAQTFSSYHTGSGNFETLTMTFSVNASASTLSCYIGMIADTVTVNTFWADGAMLVPGATPAPYAPLHSMTDLARCQRYYEIGAYFDTKVIQHDTTGGGRNRTRADIPFSVTKASAPTITTTLTGLTLVHLPTTGSAESADTANWTISGGATVDKLTATGNRNSDQTTFPCAELSFTWTASADI